MKLKEYIREKGLTNQEVANNLKITKTYVSMIATGAKVPSRKLQVAIDKMIDDGMQPKRDDIEFTVTAERTAEREITIKIRL